MIEGRVCACVCVGVGSLEKRREGQCGSRALRRTFPGVTVAEYQFWLFILIYGLSLGKDKTVWETAGLLSLS